MPQGGGCSQPAIGTDFRRRGGVGDKFMSVLYCILLFYKVHRASLHGIEALPSLPAVLEDAKKKFLETFGF